MKKIKILFLIITMLLLIFTKARGQHTIHMTPPYPITVGNYQIHQYANNSYVITESLSEPHISIIMVAEPHGSFVQIFRQGRLIVRGTAPISIKVVRPGRYKIIIGLPDGSVWSHKIFIQPGFGYLIGVTGYSTPQDNPNYYLEPVSDAEFLRMLHQLKKTTFSSTKISLLRSMAAGHYFTIHQAKLLVKTFAFDSDRLEASKILFYSLVYPEDAYMLASVFTFDSTRRKWLEWLKHQG